MTTKTEALRMALAALKESQTNNDTVEFWERKTTAIFKCQEALAQPEQPVQDWHPTEAAITALKRFDETCSDGEGYDVPKDTMRCLAAIGLIYKTNGATYCITDYGQHVLAKALAQPEQEPVAHIGMIDEEHFADVCRKAGGNSNTPLFTSPPRKEWVGLNWGDLPDEWVGDTKFLTGARWAEEILEKKNHDNA